MEVIHQLRGDEESDVVLDDDVDGPILRFIGKDGETTVELDEDRLEKLAALLAEWGYPRTKSQ